MLPTREELKRLLRYDPKTGRLFWKRRPLTMIGARQFNTMYADKEAFTSLKDGYRRGLLLQQSVYAHRVIWRLVTGEEAKELDHIDGDPLNNQWKNLRAVTRSMNCRNAKARTDNTSGCVGVVRRRGRWIAQIGAFGTTEHIGIYDTKEEAIEARKNKEEEYGFHKNHGRN